MRTTDPSRLGHAFRRSLSADGLSVIAEIKRRSPSRGELRADIDPSALAREYQDAGAACLSVLTARARFGGSEADLVAARNATELPVLRKDFLTTHDDVRSSYRMGASAMLVILADTDPARLRSLQDLALTLGVDVLTEVRTERELECAVAAGAYMIVVNQRDDPTNVRPTVDYGKAARIARLFDGLRSGITMVAASGIGVSGGTPIGEVVAAGYDAALVGEALVTSPVPGTALRELLEASRVVGNAESHRSASGSA